MPKIFLAACSHVKAPIVNSNIKPHYILESFMDLLGNSKTKEEYVKWCLSADMFLLDSGAFAFMNKANKTSNFTTKSINEYTKQYVKFINKWNIDYFFEMDLDCIYPYEKVKKARAWIEKHTGKQCIPVWHKSRGINEFIKMCDEYKYVAIGGIASKEIKKSEYNLLYELCNIAHSKGCKVHGLGFLGLQFLNNNTCPFDTVDGSSWQGHMRGQVFNIKNNQLVKEKDDRYWKEVATDNYKNWTKFSILKDKQ